MYNCCICGTPEAQLHEVFFGRGVRDLSIKYNLRVPLCEIHHKSSPTGADAHHRKELFQKLFCSEMEISFYACRRAIENHKHSRASKRYLNIVKNKLESFLEKYLT